MELDERIGDPLWWPCRNDSIDPAWRTSFCVYIVELSAPIHIPPQSISATETRTKTKIVGLHFTRTRTRIFVLEEKRQLNKIEIAASRRNLHENYLRQNERNEICALKVN